LTANPSASQLIVTQVDPQTRPSNIGPPFTGHFRITADTPRGLQPFQPGPNAFQTPGKPHPSTERAASATPASKADLNLEIRRNIFDDKGKDITPADEKDKQTNGEGATTNGAGSSESAIKAMDDAAKEPKKTFNCYSCGIDCTRLRFHYAKSDPTSTTQQEVKYDLCASCFVQGRMPNNHRGSDFVKLEEPAYTTIPDKDAPWTDSETLLLLEGLENFDDDWTSIANHVGTRTREECVMKFLQLEIQDQYLDEEPSQSALRGMNGRQPITQVENPVMTAVAFMAQMADPTVVAAAAGRSVEAMRKDLHETLERGVRGSSDKAKGKSKDGSVKHEDSMDVDASTNVTAAETDGEPNPPTTAGTVGLALAAARAGGLASHEEREMTRLVGAAVNLTLQKFDLKLQQFAEMEEIVQAERRDLEKARQQLFLDRLAFRKRMRDVEDAFLAAGLKGGQEGLRMMEEAMGVGGEGSRFGLETAASDAVPPLSAEGGAEYKMLEL
jgi:SWI/SNF related-matrix-associated actin-dependent regulator of chromatin subfamily C